MKRRPDLVEALVNLGSMRLEAGNATEALPCSRARSRFAPNNALAHLNLGDCYRLLGRYADAKKEFDHRAFARFEPRGRALRPRAHVPHGAERSSGTPPISR